MGHELVDYRAQMRVLMKLAYVFDVSGGAVLGKGAPAIMYQAGLDAGRNEARIDESAEDLDSALRMVFNEESEVWRIERWVEPGEEEAGGQEEDGKPGDREWLIFRQCPLIALARKVGTAPGGVLCQALHGYMAGMIEQILGRRVEIKTAHCGPRACKLLAETRE